LDSTLISCSGPSIALFADEAENRGIYGRLLRSTISVV